MLEDEKAGRKGWTVAQDTLARARGGGSIVLNHRWESREEARLVEQGWNVHRIVDWADIVAFAAEFARLTYEERR